MLILRRCKRRIIIKKIIEKRKTGDRSEMKELAIKFIDKECLIYSFEGHQYSGVIKEVADGALLVENDGKLEAINLDFIIRIREYPKNKKGKKKNGSPRLIQKRAFDSQKLFFVYFNLHLIGNYATSSRYAL